jgi:hypothetical protein
MEVAALIEVGEVEIAAAKTQNADKLKEVMAAAVKEAARAQALAETRVQERAGAERAVTDAQNDAERCACDNAVGSHFRTDLCKKLNTSITSLLCARHSRKQSCMTTNAACVLRLLPPEGCQKRT